MRRILVLIPALLTGCASQSGLLTPGVERVCTRGICYVRAPADVVDARCKKGMTKWDDGLTPAETPGRRARCCTIYGKNRKRFRIWVAEGDEDCVPHEHCHVEQNLSPRPDHSRCHGFGFGRGKNHY